VGQRQPKVQNTGKVKTFKICGTKKTKGSKHRKEKPKNLKSVGPRKPKGLNTGKASQNI
jgi:hypothetical protein